MMIRPMTIQKRMIRQKKKTNNKTRPTKEEMMNEYNEYKDVQPEIIGGIEKLQPLLAKAETFIKKYESYKGIDGFSEMMRTKEGAKTIKEAMNKYKK